MSNQIVWEIDAPHSSTQFSIRHAGIAHARGEFPGVSGTLTLDEELSASKIKVEIEAASLNTHNEMRDEHLRGADFFDAAQYPLISFRSTEVEALSAKELKVTGDLTLRGITKQIILDIADLTPEVLDPMTQKIKRGVFSTTSINRKEFGINFHAVLDNGGLLLADTVQISLEIELIKQ